MKNGRERRTQWVTAEYGRTYHNYLKSSKRGNSHGRRKGQNASQARQKKMAKRGMG